MQVKKKQLELDMEQQTGSKLRKEYVKAVYCHLAYLIYLQSTSYIRGFPGSSVGNLPAMQETLVRFLGQEDPLQTK